MSKENLNLNKEINKNPETKISITESDKNKKEAANFIMKSINAIKNNWNKSAAILGVGVATAIPGMAQENPNKLADNEFLNDKNKIEVSTDTIYNFKGDKIGVRKKYEVYGEKITDPELAYTANSLKEIQEMYLKGEIRAYEPHIINSRFKKLRETKYFKATKEDSIQYNGETISVRLFKKGQGKELLKYIKEAFGKEADKIIAEWGINENSYETLKNLSRDQFVRGIVHGQDKEYSKWVYLAGGKGDKGFPYVVLHTAKDGYLEGFAECGGNPSFERVSVECEDIETHNLNIKNNNSTKKRELF